jgi:hypothetical protein
MDPAMPAINAALPCCHACSLLWPVYSPTLAQFQMLLLHIVDLGYGIISRDDNPL